MAVDIITIRTEPSNSGAGDTIKDAFDKTNTNFAVLRDVALRSDNIFPDLNDPNTARFANLQVTNRVFGNLFLNPGGQVWIYDESLSSYQPVATASTTFPGGIVPGSAVFTSLVDSISADTGAITVYGGIGVRGNITSNGRAFFEQTITGNSIAESTSVTSGAIVTKGGLGVAKSVNIGQTLKVAGTTTLSGGVVMTSITQVTNTTTSTNPATGAFRVSGGTGILGNLNVGGVFKTVGDATVGGNLTVAGNISFVTDTFSITDNIMDLHRPAGGGPLFSDNGKDVGIRAHYFKSDYGDSTAFFGWANDSGAFEYYDRGIEVGDTFVGNTYGVFKGGEFLGMNATPATSTTTGAIKTAGGIGAVGNIYSGGNVVATAGLVGTVYGQIRTAAQPFITSVGVLSSLSVGAVTSSGNITNNSKYLITSGVVANSVHAATLGNTSTVINGSTISVTDTYSNNIRANTITASAMGNVGTVLTGTLSTVAQPNITSVGTLTSLAVSGNSNVQGSAIIQGSATVLGSLVTSTLSAATIGNTGTMLTGTVTTAAQPNITSVGTLASLSVGAITSSGNITNNSKYMITTGVVASTVTAGIIGNAATELRGTTAYINTIDATTVRASQIGNASAILTGTISTATQTNITTLGTLTGLNVSGGVNAATGITTTAISAGTVGNVGAVIYGNLSAGTLSNVSSSMTVRGSITATGNIASAYVLGNASFVTGNAASLNSFTATKLQTGVFINEQFFDGTQNIMLSTVGEALAVDGANITGFTLASTVTNSNLQRVGTLANLTVAGFAHLNTSVFTPTVTANVVSAAYVGNTNTVLTGTITTANQPNITSVGTLASLNVAGTVAPSANVIVNLGSTSRYWNNFYAGTGQFNRVTVGGQGITSLGQVNAATGIIASTVSAGTIGNTGATLTGTINTAAQPNITTVGTLTALTVSGNITGTLVGSVYGVLQTAAQPNITSVGTLTSLITTGTTKTQTLIASAVQASTIGNTGATLTGTISTAEQPNITSLGTLTDLTVSGTAQPNANVTVDLGSTGSYWNNAYIKSLTANDTSIGVVNVRNQLISQGNISAPNILASTVQADTIGNTGAILTGTLSTAAQPNITTVGTLTSVSVSGNITANNTSVTNNIQSGSLSTGGITATTVSAGTIGTSSSDLFGAIRTAAQTNITSVGTLSALTVSGAITASSAVINNTIVAGSITAATIGNTGATLTGTLSTAAQTNITSVGTLTSLAVTGNTSAANFNTSGQFTGSGAGLTNIPTNRLTVKTITVTAGSGLSGGGAVDLGGTVTLTNAGVTGVTGTANQVAVSGSTGSVTFSLPQNIHTTASPTFSSVVLASLSKSGTNGVGDIGQSTNRFSTVYATTFSGVAITANYADLAENYTSDSDYAPGTVVVFGGTSEITTSTEFSDTSVAGVISTQPAYLMNTECLGLPVALRGRVPVRVIGPVAKGDLLVSSDYPGAAVSVGKDRSHGAAIFAKALENKADADMGIIEAVII